MMLGESLKEIYQDKQNAVGSHLYCFTFITFLSGQFTLDRFWPEAPPIQVRWVLIVGLLIGVAVWLASYRGPNNFRWSSALPVLFTWMLWMVISSAWAPLDARIADGMSDFSAMAILVLITYLITMRLPASYLNRMWVWMVVAGLVYFVLALASGPDEQGRFAAPGGGPNVFVRIMVLAAIASVYLSVKQNRKIPLLALPVFAVGAFLSGSRGGIIAAAAVTVTFLIPLMRWLGIKRIAALVLGSVAIAFLMPTTMRVAIYDLIYERFYVQLIIDGYTSGRDTISSQAIGMFESSPVFGIGLDGYHATQLGTDFEHPHNLVLASASEGGLIGAGLLILAVAAFVRGAFSKNDKWRSETVFSLICGSYVFIAALASGGYYDSRLIWFFWALAVAYASKVEDVIEEAQGGPAQRHSLAVPDTSRGSAVASRVR